jgi:SulP family sulfate permease
MAQRSEQNTKNTRSFLKGVHKLASEQLAASLTTGLVIGIVSVITATSFAALIFSGPLSDYVSYGIGFILIGDLILGTAVALLSSYSGSIGIDQDATAAILAIMVAGVLGSFSVKASQEQRFATVVALIVITTLSTGLFFLLLGYFKLGALIRFLPYPVMGGFLAGTGWLLITGAIGVMVDIPLGPAVFRADTLVRWLPGLLFGIVLLWVTNHYHHYLVLPGMFFGAIGLFYAITWILKAPIAEVTAQEWLLGPFPSGGLWRFPLTPSNLSQVDWKAIGGNVDNLAPILVVGVISLLLNASGLELIVKKDINLNKELIVAGIGNLAGGLAGGIVGFHAISLSSLNYKMGSGSRLTGLINAAICGAAALLGASLLSLMPRMILGGILAFLGLSFLVEWIFQAWFRLSKSEFLVILLILGVIAASGFLPGVAIGVVATVILFLLNYSRMDVVRHALSGTSFKSRFTRSRQHQHMLQKHGEELFILQLQGYIFFGTANKLLEQVRDRVQDTNKGPVRFIVLDFRHVTDLDSTALLSFSRMIQLAQIRDLTLVITNPSQVIRDKLTQGDFGEAREGILRFFPDLDRGIEWCENQILRNVSPKEGMTLKEYLQEILPTGSDVTDLIDFFKREEVGAGQTLIQEGDCPDRIYFIESGQVTAHVEQKGKESLRLETMRGGRVVGELGFYLGGQRTASVVTDEQSIIYSLSRDDLEKMEMTDPEAAAKLHRIIVDLLSERVIHLIDSVNALQR